MLFGCAYYTQFTSNGLIIALKNCGVKSSILYQVLLYIQS